MYKLLVVCCLLFTVCFKPDANAAQKKPAAKLFLLKKTAPPHVYRPVQIDSTKINVRNFKASAIDKYRNSSDFDYKEAKAKAGLTWWDRFWIWFWDLIAKLFGGGHQGSGPDISFMKYVLWALLLALVIFAIVKMAGVNISNIFNRKSADIQLPYSESMENIHLITFEEEIEKALNQRNYRLAVRLLYLSTLKQLSDAQLIHWQVEKTNAAYLKELTDSGQRQSFSILTRQFEYVWYGDFPVDGRSFQNINTLFHDFKNMLK